VAPPTTVGLWGSLRVQVGDGLRSQLPARMSAQLGRNSAGRVEVVLYPDDSGALWSEKDPAYGVYTLDVSGDEIDYYSPEDTELKWHHAAPSRIEARGGSIAFIMPENLHDPFYKRELVRVDKQLQTEQARSDYLSAVASTVAADAQPAGTAADAAQGAAGGECAPRWIPPRKATAPAPEPTVQPAPVAASAPLPSGLEHADTRMLVRELNRRLRQGAVARVENNHLIVTEWIT